MISIVELRDNLTDLGRVLPILAPYWRVVYSDIIPDAGGNMERVGFIYDKRAVSVTGLAAAAHPPRKKSGKEYLPIHLVALAVYGFVQRGQFRLRCGHRPYPLGR